MRTSCHRFFVIASVLACVLVSQGCMLTLRTVPPSPPHERPRAPVPDSRMLSREEVAGIAMRIAHERGYHHFWIDKIERKDGLRWEIEIEGWVGKKEGEIELSLDGWDGHVLKIKDKRKHNKHGHD